MNSLRKSFLLQAALLVALGLLFTPTARAQSVVPLASYEPDETDLVITPNAGDSGLSISIVPGGVAGAPAATDGDYVLRVEFSNESDRKVEFRHDWSSSTYDLAGQDVLLADVYIATDGAVPGLMGIWSQNWAPPNEWQTADNIPTATGTWQTVAFDVSDRTQTSLDYIHAFIFQDTADTSGVAYLDNLHFRNGVRPLMPTGVAANGHAEHNAIYWRPISSEGEYAYNIYRAAAAVGPFTKQNATPVAQSPYIDQIGPDNSRLYYRVTAVLEGEESDPSEVVSTLYNGMTDDEMLDLVQEATFRYFWDNGHPVCGLAREGIGLGHSSDLVTTGGTGMGLMTIVVGVERGFVSRADAALRVGTILTFLDENVERYHGAWAHHYNGVTGETIAFAGAEDNGGDLIETAFLIEGILTCRQYFDDPNDYVETYVRDKATSMWEGVEWDWYRQYPNSNVLYWHWSPDYGWALNHTIRGYNEGMIAYLLAVASPTHPMPAASYHEGWAGLAEYVNGNSYYGYVQWVGFPYGGPLFWTHYSNLGFDPRYKRDMYANYYLNARNISLIDRAYCIDNPGGYADYSPLVWGLTASFNPWGYAAHCPTYDNGTITPTAAISAMPYTPAESLATMRHLYDVYGYNLWGDCGFYDAFNPQENWFASGYVAIDQGTIVPMIENYRTGLCWRLFMSNPEIKPMLDAINMIYEVDFDYDGDIDMGDFEVFARCQAGADQTALPPGCTPSQFAGADLDNDGDVDMRDAAAFQELFSP